MHQVVALAVPSVVAFDLAIPAQIFGHSDERGRYSFSVAAARPGLIPSTTAFTIEAARGLEALQDADTVVVPGFASDTAIEDATLDALRAAHARGARMVSVCTGAFALAAAGLLDRRRATTHWRNAAALASRYPLVEVDPDVLFVEDDGVSTSAGIAAGIDLCLQLVRRDLGEAHATRVARRMVMAPHRTGGQAQFIERPTTAPGPGMSAVCDWALSHLEEPLTVRDLARRARLAHRTFARRFVAETGTAPLRWLTAQRLARARQLLEETSLTVEEVAAQCGLGTAANLRVHFARDASTTPTAYRRVFRRSTGVGGTL